jgi:hypothetical protein
VSPPLAAPPGFTVVARGPRTLVADGRQIDALREAGLHDPDRWEAWLAEGGKAGGRGQTAAMELPSGLPVLLKKLRRGGLTQRLWNERFRGWRRILDNVSLPLEARRRGVATVAPVALLLLEGPPGWFRAWLAVERIVRARDLGFLFRSGTPPTTDEIAAALGAVRRMHDAGVEHRDLNVGNLLLRRREAGPAEAWVVDLDAARLHDGPLPLPLRRRSLRRLQRSFFKLRYLAGEPGWTGPPWWFEGYAPGEPDLLRLLARGRPFAELMLALHRLGWSRASDE